MALIADHPTKKYNDLLEKLEKAPSFEKFLCALEFAITNKLPIRELKKIYEKKKIINEEQLELFYGFIFRLKYGLQPHKYKEIIEGKNKQHQAKPYDSSNPVFVSLQKVFRIQKEYSDEEEKYFPRYSWFKPAYRIADILSQYYQGDDPAETIGEYLKLIFSNRHLRFAKGREGACKSQEITIDFKDQYYNFILSVSDDIENVVTDETSKKLISISNNLLFSINYINDIDTDETKSLQEIFSSADCLPQSLLSCFLSKIDEQEYEVDGELFGYILDLPLEDVSSKEKPNSSYLPLKYLDSLFLAFSDSGDVISEKLKVKIYNLLKKIRKIRLSVLCGEYPLHPASADIIYHVCKYDDDLVSQFDLPILLSWSMDEEGPLSLSYYRYKYDQYDGTTRDSRMASYMNLFDKTVEEKQFELACAVMAFFILSQCFYFRGTLGNYQKLHDKLKCALGHDRTRVVKKTIHIAIKIAEDVFPDEPGNLLLARSLKNLFPPEADIKLLGTKGDRQDYSIFRSFHRQQPDKVKNDLEEMIGKDLMEKLSDRSESFLITAEQHWRAFHAYMGSGISEWGAICLDYCKVFENELVAKFSQVENFVEFRNYFFKENGNLKKITAGNVLHVLHKESDDVVKRLPKGLLRLRENKKLLRKIRSLFAGYRNPAAHPEKFDAIKFAKFRVKLFDDELLSQFIKTVC